MPWLTLLIFATMFIIGLLIGRARAPDTFKVVGLLALTALYSAYLGSDPYFQFKSVFEPAAADFFGRIILFFVIGVGGATITNAIRLKSTPPA